MFCTQEDVQDLTGYQVTAAIVLQAQGIVEIFTGKIEEDVHNPNDIAILNKAVAYQAAYMKDNYERIFQQVSLVQLVQNASIATFKAGDKNSPWIAPLTVIACVHLSWNKSRSVKTGRITHKLYPSWYGHDRWWRQ